MASDDPIDHLYQIGLDVFVAERNALAKRTRDAAIKSLEKPSLPAWAVNQVYWHHRAVLDRLMQAADGMRQAHRQALAGRPADVRAAEAAHRDAVRGAVTAARQVLEGAGHPATAATLEAVTRTLEALPSPEANGRLLRPLAPTGFAALAGLAVAAAPPALRIVSSRPRSEDVPSTAPAAMAEQRGEGSARVAKALAREQERAARDAAASAERVARAQRRHVAEQALEAAHQALRRADAAVAAAEQALATSTGERGAVLTALARAQHDLEST
ncbi:MAG: hypothetical protein ABI880_09165 [Acidobacteriota bacterium]